ncbi:MarR family transcriptional regulator [Meiothermus cerbereus]|jgi:hypothetical protein|uniref:MarR family transcriptional regulator n=1 Tax=Meiothermus cerbereus TaxID=65552 RepID=UPI0012EC3AA0|nr:MarR family transcriptional regulator [Meiothermus cerbereus]
MSVKQNIISYLQNHSEGIDDNELTRVLGLKHRQQANMRCRELEKEGLVIRRKVNGKIHNFWAGKPFDSASSASPNLQASQGPSSKSENWFWEGNIQSKVVRYLESQDFYICSVADTASHQQGKDIVAEKDGKRLWVTVKGYPKGTDKTKPSVQARHWFKQAIFDIILYREEDKHVSLAVAMPDYPRYRKLAQKITWFKKCCTFCLFLGKRGWTDYY